MTFQCTGRLILSKKADAKEKVYSKAGYECECFSELTAEKSLMLLFFGIDCDSSIILARILFYFNF